MIQHDKGIPVRVEHCPPSGDFGLPVHQDFSDADVEEDYSSQIPTSNHTVEPPKKPKYICNHCQMSFTRKFSPVGAYQFHSL